MVAVILSVVAVALFIVLAFAGGSYFGPRVLEANATRDSTVVITSLQQTAISARALKAKRRLDIPATTTGVQTLLDARFLSSVPTNPILEGAPTNPSVAGAWPFALSVSGQLSTTARPAWIVMALGGDERARGACIAIERAFHNADRLDPATMELPIAYGSRAGISMASGCSRNGGGWGGVSVGDYIAYVRA